MLLALPVGALWLAACGGSSKGPSAVPRTVAVAPFVAPDAGFSAVFPTPPKRQTLPVVQAGVSLNVLLYEATTNHEQVAVAYTSLPGVPAQSGLDDAINAAAANVKGTVTTRADTTYLGHPAEDAVITAPGAVVHVRVVYVGDKRYLLEGVTSAANTPHPQYDALLATFRTRG